jgi:TetR/AcrR family transcriptional regulator, ethionamide resistance regulator
VTVLARPDTADRRREAEEGFLAATESLLAEGHPYAELSVERIAARAGRPRTAFYIYFRDRRDLLMRLTERVTELLYEQSERWWSGSRGADDLRPTLGEIMDTYREHASLLGAVIEASGYDERVSGFWRAVIGRFIEPTRKRLVEEGETPDAARAKAFALCWMTERTLYQQFVGGAPHEDPAVLDALVDLWGRGVYGDRVAKEKR